MLNLLIDNSVEPEGVKYLSKALKVNTTLAHLNLSGRLENDSVIVIAYLTLG